MLKLGEVKKEIDNYMSWLKELNFKKTKSKGLRYERETEVGYDIFEMSFSSYSGNHNAGFGFSKSHKAVSEITNKVSENVKLSQSVDPDKDLSIFLGVSGHLEPVLTDGKEVGMGLMMYDKQTVQEVVRRIKDRTLSVIIPELEKYEDLREIDKMVNNLDDFWELDWMKPFNLGGNFDVKRVIIAKLSGNPRYEEVVDRAYTVVEEGSVKSGYPFVYDRNDLSLPIPYTVHLLKDVEPLYDRYE